MSSLDPWEKRYVKLFASNSHGQIFSDQYVIARVPDGMVFVAAEDWPDPVKHRLAAEYGESYNTPYDFAIDKYETSANGSVPNCDPEYDFPCTTSGFTGYLESTGATPAINLNWYSHKTGCDRRTDILGADWADTGLSPGDPSGRRVHLATGVEWMVASFGTPDSIGPQFCHNHRDFWNPGTPASAGSMERCQSRYGARNMIGNQEEWANELADNGVMYTYWIDDDLGEDIGLSGGWDVATGFITSWNFNLAFPMSTSWTQSAAFSESDHFGENSGSLSSYGSRAQAARRGALWDGGSRAGRFRLRLNHGPTGTNSSLGGRCSLASPATAP
ncbi:MAG: hypothetical protein D6722_29720 [Bacteroidetes bacterium]|nr:MAG: hypothetical protein D6722_29720 [Bacteroidota bacterium]